MHNPKLRSPLTKYIRYKYVSCLYLSQITAHPSFRYIISAKPILNSFSAEGRADSCHTIFDGSGDGLHEATVAEGRANPQHAAEMLHDMGWGCAHFTLQQEQHKKEGGRFERKEKGNIDSSPSRPCTHEMQKALLICRPSRAVRQCRKQCY